MSESIAVFADSIGTSPYVNNAPDAPSWVDLLRQLGREPGLRGGGPVTNFQITNYSKSGVSFVTSLSIATNAAAAGRRYDKILVALGVNDLTGAPIVASLADFIVRAENFYDVVSPMGPIVACSITPIGFAGPTEIMRLGLNDWLDPTSLLPSSARAHGVVDRIDFANGVCIPGTESLWRPYWQQPPPDFIHPNAAGQARLARLAFSRLTGSPVYDP